VPGEAPRTGVVIMLCDQTCHISRGQLYISMDHCWSDGTRKSVVRGKVLPQIESESQFWEARN
jgi:hypothetical protein